MMSQWRWAKNAGRARVCSEDEEAGAGGGGSSSAACRCLGTVAGTVYFDSVTLGVTDFSAEPTTSLPMY